MTDRFGTFVVFVEENRNRSPLCICTTEADARGDVHEIAMAQTPERQQVADVGYVEISRRMTGLARAIKDNPNADPRGQIALLGDGVNDFDLYMRAIDREAELAAEGLR